MKDASIGRIDFLFQNIYGPADIFVLFYVTVNLFDTMHFRDEGEYNLDVIKLRISGNLIASLTEKISIM